MHSFEDCAALCGLDKDQIYAIAGHEHVPAIEASAIANHLSQPGGAQDIREVFVDVIRGAVRDRRLAHAAELLCAFRHFLERERIGEAA